MRTQEEDLLREFADAVSAFDKAIKCSYESSDSWAEGILPALARLNSCTFSVPSLDLPEDSEDVPESCDVTRQEWKAVYDRVSGILGSSDYYWSYFDPTQPKSEDLGTDCGSLADDLADIYRDVIPGLRAYRLDTKRYMHHIAFDWRGSLFGSHWGCHAVSAMRALHTIVHLSGVRKNEP